MLGEIFFRGHGYANSIGMLHFMGCVTHSQLFSTTNNFAFQVNHQTPLFLLWVPALLLRI
jgi:hypothetical protein